MSDMALLSPRTFTVAEYHRMAEIGVLRPHERLELLDGLIVEMSPIGRRHWDRHDAIMTYLFETVRPSARVIGHASFPLDEQNEPQPDIAILAPHDYVAENRDPGADDFYAIIELAETSFAKDSGPKLHLYARSRIADYLVVDIGKNILHHHSRPRGDAYERTVQLTYGEIFALTRLPDVVLRADPFLKTR